MKLPYFFLALAIIWLGISGCNPVQDMQDANNTMKGYFEAIKAKDIDKALGFYSPEFFAITPRDEWKKSLGSFNQKLGDLKTFEQTNWRIQAVSGTRRGVVFQLQYKTDYANFPAAEQFELFKPAGSKEIQIVRHSIQSNGFLQ